MKKIIFSILTTFTIYSISGQQLGQYSQYINNLFLINPAAAGAEEAIDIGLGFRQQWVGFENSPQNYYMSVNSPLNIGKKALINPSLRTSSTDLESNESTVLKLKHGIGGYVAADNYGPFNRISGVISYAIHLPIANKFHWSFGLNTGISNMNFNQNDITLINNTDATFSTFTSNQNQRTNYLDLNAATLIYNKKFYFGYTANQLLQNEIYFGDTPTNSKLNVHHYITGGYHFTLSESLKLTPSCLIKHMSPAPISMDLTLMLNVQEKYFGGFSYRNGDALIVLLGAKFNDLFRIAYSFDYTLSGLSDYNSGGHEIMLGISLNK